jgi:hypothetical protein
MPSPQKEIQQKGERSVETKYFRTWKGVFTKAKRAAIPGGSVLRSHQPDADW